ncbi:unnamed protein product [Paramecium sonneborni]|uniref:Uncharacterized protein n=1 Tax=Paramecium sonneborni TaxID=65129 RepID=A0A8S1NHE0_9CILI|nr:unnamed protein product [Paramecium sonneborni]
MKCITIQSTLNSFSKYVYQYLSQDFQVVEKVGKIMTDIYKQISTECYILKRQKELLGYIYQQWMMYMQQKIRVFKQI